MNKFTNYFLVACVIVLTGCEARGYTPEQIEKAAIYCKSHNTEILVSYYRWDNAKFKTVTNVYCGKDNFKLNIPESVTK